MKTPRAPPKSSGEVPDMFPAHQQPSNTVVTVQHPPYDHSGPRELGRNFWRGRASSDSAVRVVQMTVQKCQTIWTTRTAGSDEALSLQNFLPSSRGSPVTMRRMLYGHYNIGCLLETCQTTPLMIWEAYAASTYFFLAPK